MIKKVEKYEFTIKKQSEELNIKESHIIELKEELHNRSNTIDVLNSKLQK